MTVSLTYSIEEDQFYEEISKLLGLRAPELQKMIDLFQEIQKELKEQEEPPNVALVEEQIIEFRRSLVLLDLRLHEVTQMMRGYGDGQRDRESGSPDVPESAE
tara:strand:+ start:796 stop:1104 length:309 start_codon:yes stop_codon:yes gene_type:complete